MIALVFYRIREERFVRKNVYKLRVSSALLRNGSKLVVALNFHCLILLLLEQGLQHSEQARGGETEKIPSATRGLRSEMLTAFAEWETVL